jgi:hypothetical protein
MTQGTLWVQTPIGQQGGGAWIDQLLGRGDAVRQRIEVIRDADPAQAVDELFHRRGWTDGLPVVAPTLERVRAMQRFATEAPHALIGVLAPMGGEATVEKVAANAVMAGCRPEHFPVVLAAVRALADPAFNLRGVQTTDENVAPLLVVSGPVVRQLGINAGAGALGPGCRANASIGRALRLVMTNIGGGWPGLTSLAGIGQPGRYTLCVAENEEASPWPPLHTEAGLPALSSAITLLRAECSINVTGGLAEIASVMGSAASAFSALHAGCVAVIVAPATATALAARGWGKGDIAQYLFAAGRIPHAQWRQMWVREHIVPDHGAPAWVHAADRAGAPIPVVAAPEDIVIFVAGGSMPIAQHVYFPGWGFPYCRLTQPVVLPPHWPFAPGSEP